jgi:8-hydroxy-5-deazaflavin:NADPH oxidoreductase
MAPQRASVIGSGIVGEALANGLLAHGWEVMRGSRDPSRLADWRNGAGPAASTGDFAACAAHADLVVLAVKGAAAESALGLCGQGALDGKIVIDTTNPIADAPPEDGVLLFFTAQNESLMERLQVQAPAARFVKAFSSVGAALMVHPELPGGPPTMFVCGDDPEAKRQVSSLLVEFGWEIEDLGTAKAARAIEPLCMLWCIPGFRDGDWAHAFKMLR